MRNCVLLILLTLLVLVLGAFGFALLGFLPTNADATPPAAEAHFANLAMDASMGRHAPRVNCPLPPTDDAILDGMKLYTMNCATCHGALSLKPSPLGQSFYPPAPQLIVHPLDDPEWHIYYSIRTGLRYTGMPAWGKSGMSEQDMWKITLFLARVDKLSPALRDYWKKTFAVDAPTPHPDGSADHD